MKAIEALKQINAIFSEYVAIAKDSDGAVCAYESTPLSHNESVWLANAGLFSSTFNYVSEEFSSKIEWNSDDWTKNIVTINDLKDEQH